MQRSSCVRLRPTHSATPQASARGPWLLPRFWRFVGLYALGAALFYPAAATQVYALFLGALRPRE